MPSSRRPLPAALLCAALAAPLAGQGPASWTVSPEPLVEIGGMDGARGVLLTRIVGAVALPDGRFVVADGGENHLVLIAADGSVEGTVGREGEGPGEFTNLRGVWATPDGGFGAWDSRQNRLTRFAPDGTLVDTHAVVPQTDDPRTAGANLDAFHGALPDGRVVLSWIKAGFEGRVPPRETPLADRMVFGLFGVDGDLDAILGEDTGMVRWYHEGGGGPLPFSPYAWTAAVADTLVSTDGTGEARFFAPEVGGPQRVLALPGEAPDRDDAWAVLDARAAAGELSEMAASRLPLLDRGAGPIPAHGRMLADDAGHLWLKAYEPGDDALALRPALFAAGGTWTVVDTDGEAVALVVMPDDLAPLNIVGDRLLALGRDAFDVERFVVVRLHR